MEATIDYAQYVPALSKTPLFRNVSEDEMTRLLEAMAPPLRVGRAKPGATPGCFQLVVRCIPEHEPAPCRWRYGMPAPGEVGMMMGELAALSRKDLYVRRFSNPARGPMPKLDWEIESLEISVDALEADLGPDLAGVQIKVLRNLAGMMAQKASDIRRDLYLETIGADMYGPEYLIE